jgi:hypothetical protein
MTALIAPYNPAVNLTQARAWSAGGSTRFGSLRALTSSAGWLESLLVVLIVAVAGIYVVGFLIAAYFRVTYAHPLWVMEIPSLQAVRRIMLGQPLYGPPTLAYVPALYAPLYFYISALAAHLFSTPLITLRLVSVIASLGTAGLAAHLVWQETRNRLSMIVAAGLSIGCTALTANTLDLARVDPLSTFFLVGALGAARSADVYPRRAVWLSALSGLLGGLAILTKQTAFVVVFALAVHVVSTLRRRPIAAFCLTSAMTVALAWIVLTALYGGWIGLYLISLPRQHELDFNTLLDFWSKRLLPTFSLPLIAGPLFLIERVQRRDFASARFWSLATAGMLALAWGAMLNRYSAENVLLPAYVVLAMLAALGLDTVLRRLHGIRPGLRMYRVYILGLVLLAFVIMGYNPRATSPLRSDTWAAERMVSTLHSLPGEVYGPDYTEFLTMAGKGEQAAGLSVDELAGGFGGTILPEGAAWLQAYAEALKTRRFSAVVLDPESVEFFLASIASSNGYIDTGPLFPPGDDIYQFGSKYVPKAHVWLPAERAGEP